MLEPRLGHSFGSVRVHADGAADQLAEELDASALTVGQDIYFRANQYNTQSDAGMRLLAHEAVHTIQQGSGSVAGRAVGDGVALSDPFDRFERAAAEAAEAVVAKASPPQLVPDVGSEETVSASTMAVQRSGPPGFIPDWVGEADPNAWPFRKFWEDPHNPRWYPRGPPSSPPGMEGEPRPYPIRPPEPNVPPSGPEPEPPPTQEPWHGPPEDWEGPETLRSPGEEGAEAGNEAAEAAEAAEATEATEAAEAAEAAEAVAEGGEVAEGAVEAGELILEGGSLGGEAAAGLGAAEFGLLGLAGYGGYKAGEFIGEGLIDPYLNRAHSEEIPADALDREREQVLDPTITNYADTIDQGFTDSWAYTINQWLED